MEQYNTVFNTCQQQFCKIVRTYDCTYDDWVHIKRPEDQTISISEKAKKLASFYSSLINKRNGPVIVSPSKIGQKTGCKSRQNYNLHKQLTNIFEIKYHHFIKIGHKRYFNVFVINYTKNGKFILDNPISAKNKIFNDAKLELNMENTKNLLSSQNLDNKGLEIDKNNGGVQQFNAASYNEYQNSIESFNKDSNRVIDLVQNFNFKDFYPLSDEDCRQLQKLSTRDFTLNAMNQILLDMSRRLTGRSFESKRQFLIYMGKALKGEKRDVVSTSNITFRIKNNLIIDHEDAKRVKEIIKQEKYLTEIENNLEVSPELHFKKKLASIFDREFSYKLLTSYKYIEIVDEVFYIALDKELDISESQKELILSQAKATHESFSFSTGQAKTLTKIEFIMPKTILNNKVSRLHDIEFTGKWGEIRKKLIADSLCQESGKALDRSWFSKLTFEENIGKKEIILRAPTEFIKDWIETNYGHKIEKHFKEIDYLWKIIV